jgi:phosphate transport system substrate-binding protein
VSFTNAPGKNSYPIVAFTWLYVPVDNLRPERARALANFIRWIVTNGQSYAEKNGFAPLPASVVTDVKESLGQLGQ